MSLHTVDSIADLAGLTVEAFLSKAKGELGDDLPDVHKWDSKSTLSEEAACMILDWLGLEEEAGKLDKLDQRAITQSDVAIKESKIRLVNIIRLEQQQAIQELSAQSNALAITSGANDGISFVDNYSKSFTTTVRAVMDESWTLFDEEMDRLDQKAIQTADSVGKRLAEGVQRQAKARQRIQALESRVNRLIS